MKKNSQFNDGLNKYNDIKFILNRKDIRNLIIKIDAKNNIKVSVPKKINDKLIKEFLDKYLYKFNKHSINKSSKSWLNEQEKWFYLFGQKITFEIDDTNKKVIINNKKISFLNKSIEEAINSFRKKQLKAYLLINQLKFQKIMNIPDHLIKVRSKSTAWATNHVNKKTIFYSTNLSSYSTEIIDYVIVHELSHNKFPNHPKEFWNFVSMFENNFKIKRNKLKKSIYY